ncbi:MAG: hypothetical protein IM638_09420 [Bacteroidetes bacterium]|nr:hypothetical protein [Bacteroidota bacterium]
MQNITQVIDKLNSYEFHDTPVASMEFKSGQTVELVLHLLIYNEGSKDYDKLRLSFQEINKLESSPLFLTSNSELELFRFDYEYKDGFFCKLQLLSGIGEPSLSIDLTCQAIDISPE